MCHARGFICCSMCFASRLPVPAKHLLLYACAFATALTANAGIKNGYTYIIRCADDTNKVLTVENSSFDNYTPVVAWTYTHVPAQQWLAEKKGNGTFALKNVFSGKYLSPAGENTPGNPDFVQTSGNNNPPAWTLSPCGDKNNSYTLSHTARTPPHVWIFAKTEPTQTFDTSTRDEMMAAWLHYYLRQRDGGGITFGKGGGWGDAEMLEILLDAYETSGNCRYLDTFADAFGYFRKNVGDNWLHSVYTNRYSWSGHDFNDDVMWMIIASVRMYLLTGNEQYRTLAKSNFDAVYSRAMLKWGMLRWAEKSGHVYGTNSCINGPAEVAACYIAQSLDNDKDREEYYEKARLLYEKQRTYLFEETSGKVFDCFVWNDKTDTPERYNHWISTYNQGTMLGAAIMLYKHYGNERYRRDADKIVGCTLRELCNKHGIVKVCQTVDGDLCGFKGILMRYIRMYAVSFQHTEMAEWLQKNAFLAFNNRNSHGITSSAWLTKTSENWTSKTERDKDGKYKNFYEQAFGNSSAVAAAVNVPPDLSAIRKDAFSELPATAFDMLRGVSVGATNKGKKRCITGIADGFYAGYTNINFGERNANKMRVRIETDGTHNIKIEVRTRSFNGRQIASFNVPARKCSKTIATTTAPISGCHDIFLVFRTGNTKRCKLKVDWLTFDEK